MFPSNLCLRCHLALRRGFVSRNTGHHQADFFHGGLAPLHDADDLPLVHHRDPVGEAADFVQILGDEQDGRARGALLQQPLVDVFRCADVDPTRGLRGDQDLGFPRSSRARMSFWIFPPDRFLIGVSRLGVLTENCLTRSVAWAAILPKFRKMPARVYSGAA